MSQGCVMILGALNSPHITLPSNLHIDHLMMLSPALYINAPRSFASAPLLFAVMYVFSFIMTVFPSLKGMFLTRTLLYPLKYLPLYPNRFNSLLNMIAYYVTCHYGLGVCNQ
jgi:hypothetical protein